MADTIVAIATPRGAGGIGVLRLSGPLATPIAAALLGRAPTPRFAHYAKFHSAQGELIDSGLLLHFPGPQSFTGEDVLELHCHGSEVVLAQLQRELLSRGARPARPGEFSERAFLNDKIDLTQAEAIADLINARSEAAARAATRSLEGAFSREVDGLVKALIDLRVWIEAALDFPEEEIDFLADHALHQAAQAVLAQADSLCARTRQGVQLSNGFQVVIAGRPNAGKSSLLNALAQRDSAIVTPVAGTTRDVLKEHVELDGLRLTLVDTAGLRDTHDLIEAEGVRRALAELARADHVLWLIDATDPSEPGIDLAPDLAHTRVYTKVDLLATPAQDPAGDALAISTATGAGLDLLRTHLLTLAGADAHGDGGTFSARARHVHALERAQAQLSSALAELRAGRGELAAECLRVAQEELGSITGTFSSDDLLGEIFSSFCIGK